MLKRLLPLLVSGVSALAVGIRKWQQRRLTHPKGFPLQSIKHTANSITFNWNNSREVYRIFKNNELLYEGAEQSFTDENLPDATDMLYYIERSAGGRRKPEKMKIQTATSPKSERSDHPLEDMVITTAVSKTMLYMEWEPIEGVDEYNIYRNGRRLARVERARFVDRRPGLEEETEYSIHAERPLSQSDEFLNEEKHAAASVVSFFKKGQRKKDATRERFHISKTVAPVRELLQKESISQKKIEWSLLYKTFLPDKWIKNPNPVSPLRTFRGDDRDFDPKSPHYRTKAEVVITAEDIKLERDVGVTKGYGPMKLRKKEETASADGIQLEDETYSEELASYTLKHSVGNPLVVSPTIDYEVKAEFYANGLYDIMGKHDQSPNHEIYIKQAGQRTWKTVHLADSEGLEWMADPLAEQFWRASNMK